MKTMRNRGKKTVKAKTSKTKKKMKKSSTTTQKKSNLRKLSYELRTPLNSIMGFSELMRNKVVGAINQQQKEYLNDIFASAKHLLKVINERLEFSTTKKKPKKTSKKAK